MELIYECLIIFTTIQRILELFLSKSNEKHIVSLGGKVMPEINYVFMVLLHTSWLLFLIYYTFLSDLIFNIFLFIPFLLLFLIGQSFRILAIKALGKRWSTRVMILPDAPAVEDGLFKFVRHPNYLGVVLEIAALPLIVGLWKFALIFSTLNGIILYFRIKFEEAMLTEYCHYDKFLERGKDR